MLRILELLTIGSMATGFPSLLGLSGLKIAVGTLLGAIAIILGLLTLLIGIFATCVFVLPKNWARNIVRVGMWPFYRLHRHGVDRLPKDRGALLVANHISWLDGVLMLLVNRRHVRMMVYAGNFQNFLMRRAGERWGVIVIGPGPKAIIRALKSAREAIENGELVGLFPEGGISRSGITQSFKPGLLKIVNHLDADVIPIYFDGLWGSIFSFERQRFFWKIPRRIPLRIDTYFGAPLRHIQSLHEVRQAVQQLGAKTVNDRLHRSTKLPESVIKCCKQRKFSSKIADSSGADLTGGAVLMRSLILRRLLRREVLREDEKYVGVLLPPSTGAVLTNMAIAFDRRVAVNLNYTVSSDVMNECIEQAGITHVLTSQRVVEKLDLQINAELVFLEDLRPKLTLADKLTSAIAAYVLPARMVSASLGLDKNDPDDVLTLIFTSGSTGIPKGVMLTHANIRSNVDAIDQVIGLKRQDGMLGILPFFHSFGYTVTLWAVLAIDIKGLYHFNPLDARQVGKLIHKHKATILLATPTFLRSYLRRCTPEELDSVDTVVAGAEKLPKELCDAFEKKFKIRPVEGYGTTELSPLVSVNVPPSRTKNPNHQVDRKEGTVGRPVPGVAAKVVDEDGHELGVNQSGMLLISGANVMKGYLHQPEKTAEVIRDGWYVTGDVAEIDNDGFITITGRESRFSKIGGEMVPHLKIEECLMELVGSDQDDDDQDDSDSELKIAVTSVPDSKKGERIIVLHTTLTQTPVVLIDGLKQMGLPNLFIPSEDSFLQVKQIPVLGTGKLDLKAVKDTALDHYGQN